MKEEDIGILEAFQYASHELRSNDEMALYAVKCEGENIKWSTVLLIIN